MEWVDPIRQAVYAVMTPVSDFIWSYILFYLLLTPIALRVLRDYERQRSDGVDEPVFDRQILKNPDQVEPGIWDPGETDR